MYNKKTKSEIIDICSKFGLEWIDGEYLNIYSKIKCKDNYGFLYDVTLNGLLMGDSPNKFNKSNRYSLHNLHLHFELYNPTIELLTDKYEHYDAKLKCKCKICNNLWNPTYNSIKVGKGCPKCAGKDRTGALCVTLAERNKDKWAKKTAKVYIIKCVDSNELFYKIGITTRNVSDRFSNKANIPYLYETLYEINTNLYEAVYIEKELHYENKDFKYEPLIKFDGHTECFSNVNENAILIIKNNIENHNVNFIYKTSCHIDVDNILKDIRLLTKPQLVSLVIKLNSYRLSAKNLGLLDEYTIKGYKVDEWITDIKTRLDSIFQNEKKIEIELAEIEALLK